jgi:ATP-dependent Clp protease adaptor protein ClpS
LAGGVVPVVLPDIETKPEVTEQRSARVILYNDDWHTFDDVIVQLMLAVHCSWEVGEAHAWTIHTQGRDVVYQGGREECERIAGVLRQIRLQVEVDW